MTESRILQPAKAAFKNEGHIKSLSDQSDGLSFQQPRFTGRPKDDSGPRVGYTRWGPDSVGGTQRTLGAVCAWVWRTAETMTNADLTSRSMSVLA